MWKNFLYVLLLVPVLSLAEPACVLEEVFAGAEISKIYHIEDDSSQVAFRVDSSIGHVEGVFESFYGGISLTKHGRGEGHTAFVIQADTLDTDGAIVKAMLKGENFFDVDDFPDITFVSRSFEWIDNNNAILTGNLTIREITNTIDFTISIKDTGYDRIIIFAQTVVDREAFGMDALSSVVENDVELIMTVEATKYQ